MILRWFGLVIVVAVPITFFLSHEFAGPRGHPNSTSFDEPFRATEVRTVTLATSERFVAEIEFESPNAWRRHCPAQPYCSTIVIGDQAWNLQGDSWVEISAPAMFISEALELARWAGPDLQVVGAGPAVSKEATRQRRAYYPYYGESLEFSGATNKRGEPVSTYRDATLTITTLHGESSGRLYEIKVLIIGPHIRDETIVTLEYDVDVGILPPLTAAKTR